MADWYPFYPSLYDADTLHLSLAEHGAYRLLIDWYMANRRPPPDNDQALARVLRVGIDEWLVVAANVRPFFKSKAGALHHKRCDTELDRQDNMSRKRTEKSKKGAQERWRRNKTVDAASNDQALPDESNGHDAGNGREMPEPMPGNATGQDKTGEDKTPIDRESPLTVTPAVAVVDPVDDGLDPPAFLKRPGKGPYVFEGRHIRLNQGDFDRWQKAYHAIPDLAAELQRLDDYATGNHDFAKSWFHAVSGALKKRHEAILAGRTTPPSTTRKFGAPGFG